MIRLVLAAGVLTAASVTGAQEPDRPADLPPGVTTPYTCTVCAARKQRLKGGRSLLERRTKTPAEGSVIARPPASGSKQPAESPGAVDGN